MMTQLAPMTARLRQITEVTLLHDAARVDGGCTQVCDGSLARRSGILSRVAVFQEKWYGRIDKRGDLHGSARD